MSLNAHSILAPTLPIGVELDVVVDELGEPQDRGRLGKTTLLAYRDKTIQVHLLANRLCLLAFHMRSEIGLERWPRCFAALEDFSDQTTILDVEKWLEQRGISGRCIDVCGEQAIATQCGVRFCFQSGCLQSIQSLSNE